MIERVKEENPSIIVVLGDLHVSSLPDRILDYFKKADFTIRGEEEITLRKLSILSWSSM